MLTLLVAVIMTGCQKDRSADVKELFRTVPNTASYVLVADLHSIIEKSGSKVDGDKIVPGPELEKALSQASDTSNVSAVSDSRGVRAVLNGNSGVEPSVVVAFGDGFSQYIVGNLSSTSKFQEFVTKNDGGQWKEQDGIKYNGIYAISENRFWINVSSRNIDADKIKEYLALSEKQSFAGGDFASMLEDADKDLVGWCDLDGIMNTTGVHFQRRAMFKMVSAAMFKDPEYAVFDMNFEKGALKIGGRLLDGKGKDAKYLMSAQKIDEKVLDKIDGNGDALMVMSVPQKLIKQIQKMSSGQLSMVGIVAEAMGCIDGTVAVAIGDNPMSVKGVIQTNGKSTSDLMFLLQQMDMQVTKEGNELLLTKGELNGSENVKNMAAMLKGCSMGAVMDASAIPDYQAVVKNVVFKMVPKSGSMVMDIQLNAKDTDVNFIVGVLKEIN